MIKLKKLLLAIFLTVSSIGFCSEQDPFQGVDFESELIGCPVPSSVLAYEMINPDKLTQQERDFIVEKMKFALKKVDIFMAKSEASAKAIKNVNVRNAFLAAIGGAIMGWKGGTPASLAMGACLATMANIIVNATDKCIDSYNYMEEAKRFGILYEDLQLRLWYDE